jgi:hypothetical protein
MSEDNKLFKCAGVSSGKTGYKVRFASDMTRVKVLMKTGNEDIELVELPTAMTKSDAVAFLKTSSLMDKPEYAAAITNADAKYNAESVASVARVRVTKAVKPAKVSKSKAAPSIEDIRARVKASKTSEAAADMLGEAVAALVAESQREVSQA